MKYTDILKKHKGVEGSLEEYHENSLYKFNIKEKHITKIRYIIADVGEDFVTMTKVNRSNGKNRHKIKTLYIPLSRFVLKVDK